MSTCWMIPELDRVSVAIVYVYVPNSGPYHELAQRFIGSYSAHPPEYPHRTVIVCNGGEPSSVVDGLFAALPNRTLMHHNNAGKDIGAYQRAAREVSSELTVFFGASTYFRRGGWLKRMVESYQKHGPTLYGATGNRGNPALHVYPHIRTTAFWLPTSIFNACPHKVTRDDQRYPFEHGRFCLTDWIAKNGMVPLVVSWTGEYPWEHWDAIPNGYHNGDQSNVLVGDRLTAPPYWVCP